MLNLKDKYQKQIIPEMMKKFGYKNVMAVPKIRKVVINIGFGRMMSGKGKTEQKKIYEPILDDLALIVGQRSLLTMAKKSISSFKVRKGMPVGAIIILRGQKMYDFLERLIYIGLPRSRDFQGLSPSSFDKKGNLTIGIKEHICFCEVSPEKAKSIFGFEVTVNITAPKEERGMELLRLMGFPIKK